MAEDQWERTAELRPKLDLAVGGRTVYTGT
jgi:hypothetical protein